MALTTQQIIQSLVGAGALSVVRLSSSKLHYAEILQAAANHENAYAQLEADSDRLVLILERNSANGSTLVNASTEQRS